MKIKKLLLFMALLVSTLACGVSKVPVSESIVVPATVPPVVAVTFTPIPTLTPAAPTDQLPMPKLSQTVTMQSTPFSETGSAPLYKITADFPSLQGSEDARVTTFNAFLKQIVQDEIDQFKTGVLSSAQNPPIVAGSDFILQYAVIGQRADFWSIKFDISFYADGAAHPGHYSHTLTYDLQNGHEVTLDELFLSNSNYLQVIADNCKAQLATRDIGFDGFAQGADPVAENYQHWNISNDGLVITFDEYQVAPYAAGPQVVTIPFSALQSSINPQGALTLFAQ